MYRQFGSSALFLLLLTSALSHVTGPSRSLAARGAASGAATAAAPASAVEADEHTCYVFDALRRFYGTTESGTQAAVPPTETPLPGISNCTAANFAALFPAGLPEIDAERSQILIATVPDPLQTSEALQFDRNIAALQEAASTAGYDFQWMTTPWAASDLANSKDLKDEREVDHYREKLGDQPGALLFRKRTPSSDVNLKGQDALLLLVLVPESPIYGLNLKAAREGLGAVSTLLRYGFRTAPAEEAANPSRVRWIGPSYSASAPGLRVLQKEVQPRLSFNVLSGTISTKSADSFLVQLDQGDPQAFTANDTKATLTELDTDALCWFLGQASRSGNFFREPVAILQEDETAYGGNVADSPGILKTCKQARSLVRFTFPRGISHVRRVYGGTLKAATSSQTQQDGETAGGNVPFSFHDELEDPMDTAPEFSPQFPVSNESALSAIASDIKHIHARAIIIRTSDPLDQLFLARYFRKECPNSRLVLFNAERLLTRLRGDFNLDGTLIVTRFPLFRNAFLQTPFIGESRHSLTFANSREEAIFLAALLQMKAGPLPLLQSPFPHQHFAMAPWIGVAAGGDFWPVAYFGKDQVASPQTERENVLLLTDTPPEPLPALWTLVTLSILALAVIHFFCFLAGMPLNDWLRTNKRAWARRIAQHRLLSYYLVPVTPSYGQSRLYTGQCWWLLNASTQFVLLLAYLLFPVITYQAKVQNITSAATAIRYFPVQTTMIAVSTFIVLMLQFCMSGALFFLLSRRYAQLGKGFFVRVENLLLPAVSLLWIFVSLTFFYVQLTDSQTGFAFASRCLHLSSGVCPILPLLLTSFGFLLATVVNLNALSMAITRNPGLPVLHWPYLDMATWKEKLGRYTELWYGLPGSDGKLLAVVVLLGCLLLHPRRMFATFDTPIMSWLYTLNFVLLLWTIVWLWLRFIRIWRVLRSGMDCIEGSPLRFAFSRLPAIFSVDPIWSYSGLRRVVVLPMRWFEYFKISPDVSRLKTEMVADNLQDLRIIVQELRDTQWLDNVTYTDFSQTQNEYAIRLSETDAIRASWERGGPDCVIGGAPPAKGKSAAEDSEDKASAGCSNSRGDVPSPCGTVFEADNCLVEHGNEFIAMRIAAYIRYITLHMKNLMTFMSLGFLLTLLAAVSYPFDKPQIIAWSATLILICLLFTVGTVLAQMDRDAVLSRMSNTAPGQVRYMAFVKHMLAVGGLPLITIMATLFPSIGGFLFSWASPVLEALR
ncbi:MAG TPA: hypothetical protein VHB45_03340 [Alloacidobacterium sp.]|nr:hypothetical protein [Alloacidobacterium sp.]